jgi:hypothetical protein
VAATDKPTYSSPPRALALSSCSFTTKQQPPHQTIHSLSISAQLPLPVASDPSNLRPSALSLFLRPKSSCPIQSDHLPQRPHAVSHSAHCLPGSLSLPKHPYRLTIATSPDLPACLPACLLLPGIALAACTYPTTSIAAQPDLTIASFLGLFLGRTCPVATHWTSQEQLVL